MWEGERGFNPFPVPEIVGEAEPETPAWMLPFWAGLCAAFGQTATLTLWFFGTRRREAGRRLRHGKHVLGSLATGWMWMAVTGSFLARFWVIYTILVVRGNVWGAAFGEPLAVDPLLPFVPFGAAAFLLVLHVALEPWRGIRFEYRSGWWPALGVAATLALGAVLYGVGVWALPA